MTLGQQLSPQLGGHRGVGSTALLPSLLTSLPSLASPHSDEPKPPFPSPRGATSANTTGPPTLCEHPGAPSSHPEGTNPLAPRSPLPVGPEARSSGSHTAMAQRCGGRRCPHSRPRHPRQERDDPLGSGDEPPARGRALPAAACPGFLPHEQTLEKLVHSSRTTARASDKPRWLPAIPSTQGPCTGCH